MLAQDQAIIAEDLAKFTHDPLAAVLYGFPWGEGELEGLTGPRQWQREVFDFVGRWLTNSLEGEDLERFGNDTRHQPCRIAISSGNGPGKSTLAALLGWQANSTFEDCRINVTANTKNQLDTKTSPEFAKWFRIALNSDWFEVNVTSIKVKEADHAKNWRIDFIPWSADNPAAIAGQHNKGKRMVMIADEASEIADVVFETLEGAMTDEGTEILVLLLGNPTWNHGYFYDAVFGRAKHLWKSWILDSRNVEGTNKRQIAEWLQYYGEDSDWFRVHVRGLPPRASSAQYFDMDLIQNAQKREVAVLPDEPLVAGVDFAWGGDDDNVIQFRRGHDARSIKPIRIKGEFTRDPAVMVGKLSDVLSRTYDGRKVSMLFLDSAGIAAPVEARLRQLRYDNIVTVNFGAHSPDPRYAYMRDYMWGKMKEWMANGAIDKDPQLEADLSGPCLVSDLQQRVKLEDKERMKKRGLHSPDRADALALTFAMPVAPQVPEEPAPLESAWMDQGQGWME